MSSAHIPVLEEASSPAPEEVRPSWRGWLHAGMLPLTIAAGIVLICLGDGAVAKWTSAVFMVTSIMLFGNSALYHRFAWKPKTKLLLKRIDHSNIFLLIAGTYTPMAALTLPGDKAAILLTIVWSGAILGIAFRVFWIGAPRWLYVALYLLLGWAAVMYVVDIFTANPATMILVGIGGIAYSLGAVAYALKRPNPFPGRFGFHEVFHAFTVIAFLCHWTAILLVAIAPPNGV